MYEPQHSGEADQSTKDTFSARIVRGLRCGWRSLVLWGAVAVVLAGIIVVVALCIKGRLRGDLKAHPAGELQIAALVRRPKGDVRRYQHTVLPNGLQVVNVEDSSSKSSAYSMAVKAGSFDDPKELPGLAHFCEHMLFLGTQSYPDPFGYDNFVSSSGGFLNAYTAEEITVFYTEIASSYAGEGLNRFADLFRAPIFSEEYAEREVHAIDSEHSKNVQDPAWRVSQIMNSLANEASPVSAFHTGNLNTLYEDPRLRGMDPIESLRNWFEEHYCPSRYHLVTYGPEPLETQLERVFEDFSNIPAGNSLCQDPRQSWQKPEAWGANNTGHWVTIQGMQPQSELVVFFPLPDMSKEYLSQPLRYIEYSITYGGENSFTKAIRDTFGLAGSVAVSSESTSAGTALFFSCRLSAVGRDHPELVLDLLFQYLHTLQNHGVSQELYHSLANISKIGWDWRQALGPADTASDLAARMTRLPPSRLLSGADLIEDPDLELVASLMQKLTPARMNVGLVDPDASKTLFGNDEVLTSEFYGTQYTLSTVDAEFPGAVERWESWQNLSSAAVAEQVSELLKAAKIKADMGPNTSVEMLPRPITGIAADFSLDHMWARQVPGDSDINQQLFGPQPARIQDKQEELEEPSDKEVSGSSEEPEAVPTLEEDLPERTRKLLHTGPSVREAWYRSGWVHPSPKVQMQFLFRPRMYYDNDDLTLLETDALSNLRLGFYTSLLAEEIVPKLFDLSVAGASFDIGMNMRGGGGTISLAFEGFPPLLPLLIKQTVQELEKGVRVQDHVARFGRIQKEFEESFQDFSSMPVDYAVSDRNLLLTPGTHSREESLSALWNVTPSNVENAPDQLVKSRPLDLTALIMGNLNLAEAEDAVDWVMQGLSGAQASTGSSEGPSHHLVPVVNPSRPVELRKRNPRDGDASDVAIVSIVAGVATVESRVLLGLIGQLLSIVAYNDLRTERQLGYVVSAGVGQLSNVQFISTVVQGEAVRADDLEIHIERVYFQLMPERLRNLTQKEFKSYKESFRQQLLQPPAGRSDEFSHFWSHLQNRGACFSLLNEMLEFLDHDLESKDALVEVWDKIAMPKDQSVRKKVVVKYFAGEVPPRPSSSHANSQWLNAGFNIQTAERLSIEYGQSQVFTTASSTTRKAIVETGGYFPTTLHCTRETAPKEMTPPQPEAPQPEMTHSEAADFQDDSPEAVFRTRRKGRDFLQPDGRS